MSVLGGWSCERFQHGGKGRDVYRRGDGPAVVIVAEIPGITPGVVGFADRVVNLGCTAVLPHLFGQPGTDVSLASGLRTIVPLCVSREMSAWATGRTTPVIAWLRALAADAHRRSGGPGVGAVGMCFTGGYALAMLPEPAVLAPVLSQPSLPFPVSRRRKGDVQVGPDDVTAIQARLSADPELCVLGLRFSEDSLAPPARFARLHELLGDRFVAIEIDSSPGNPWGLRQRAHSVLTEELVDEPGHPTRDALEQVLDLFRRRLLLDA